MVAPAIVDHGFMMSLDDISLSEESGWRETQEGIVQDFEAQFPAKYGKGIHRNPRVLLKEKPQEGAARDAAPKFAEDVSGKNLLDDG